MRTLLKKAQRIVIKLGTGLLTDDNGLLDTSVINKLVPQIALLMHEGKQIILVSSGAIGCGFQFLNLDKRPSTLPLLQASASVGQAKLMNVYDKLFSKKNITIAQILLTREDLKTRKRHLNIKNTLNCLINRKALPIINENDTVSIDEIRFGDNDLLSALVANLLQADLLINLTNVDGVRKKSADGKSLEKDIIPSVKGVPSSLLTHTIAEKSALGSGGMDAKLKAARIITTAGECMVIANGRTKNILLRICNGEDIGTLFIPSQTRMESRKRWIAFFHGTRGTIVIDQGAQDALLCNGKSLLPSGIVSIEGKFAIGDSVALIGLDRKEIGIGLVNFSSDEIHKIRGCHSSEIEKILGYRSYSAVIHRDNFVTTRTLS
ncbi:MAG: glutamate 5-kinase [bacterium]|nr:glutamate 5-kinase [bacterium]